MNEEILKLIFEEGSYSKYFIGYLIKENKVQIDKHVLLCSLNYFFDTFKSNGISKQRFGDIVGLCK